MRRFRRFPRRGGLSLIEVSFSTVILALLIVMSLGTLGALSRGQLLITSRSRALCLGSQLMTEILQNPYEDPTNPVFGLEQGESTASRAAFNDVDDYAGWTESPSRWKDGTLMSGLTGWTRTVAVAYVDPITLNVSAQDGGLKRITVTVNDPQGRAVTLTGLRARNGVCEAGPNSGTTYLRWVGIEFQAGGDGSVRVQSGANVLGSVAQ